MLAEARSEFREQADRMSRSDDTQLMEAVENAATLAASTHSSICIAAQALGRAARAVYVDNAGADGGTYRPGRLL